MVKFFFYIMEPGKIVGKQSVLLLRRREEVVHIPKVVTHTRTSHQHVEQTVEVRRKRNLDMFFKNPDYFGNNMSTEASVFFFNRKFCGLLGLARYISFVLSGITLDFVSALQVPVPMQQEEQVHVPKIMTQTRSLDDNDMRLV